MTRPKARAERGSRNRNRGARRSEPAGASAHTESARPIKSGGSVGLVVVHGIGNRQAGRHFEKMVSAMIPHLGSDCRRDFQAEPAIRRQLREEEAVDAEVGVIKYDNGRVLCVDGFWGSGVVNRPSRFRAAIWLVSVVPALLLLLGPDKRDQWAFTDEDGPKAPNRIFLASLGRLSKRLLVAVITVCFFLQMPGIIGAPIFAALCVVAAIAASRSGLLTDVYLAVAADAEAEKIRKELAKRVHFLLRRCRHVTILGHSQGGYLSYLAVQGLDPGLRSKCNLVGAASGLKPIWILRILRQRSFLVLAWGIFVVEVLVLTYLAVEFNGGLAAVLVTYLKIIIVRVVELLRLPLGAHDFPTEIAAQSRFLGEFSSALGSGLLESTLRDVGFLVALLLLSLLVRPWVTRVVTDAPTSVPNVGGLRRWIEISSHHDMVGRMILPRLPSATETLSWPVTSNLFLDHVLINRRNTVFSRYVALIVKGDRASKAQEHDICAMSESLEMRLQRWRALAGALLAVSLFGVLVWQSYSDGGLLGVFTSGSLIIWPIMVCLSACLVGVSFHITCRADLVFDGGRERYKQPYVTHWSRWLVGLSMLLSFFSGTALVLYNFRGFFAFVPVVYGLIILSGFLPSIAFLTFTALGTLAFLAALEPWTPRPPGMPEFAAVPALPAGFLNFLLMAMAVVWLSHQKVVRKRHALPAAVRK